MTRSELIQLLSEKQQHLSYKETETLVKHVFDQMTFVLEQGGRIEIRGFGSFSVRFRPKRQARNPKTGEDVIKEARYTPHFKPGKELRDRVNKSANEYPIEAEE